jgi:serine/threonine-protein kinase
MASALEGLLLSPEQISTAMGTTGLKVTGTITTVADYGANVADMDCRILGETAEKTAYFGSGWSAVQGQNLDDAGDIARDKYFVQQALVLFPSAPQAAAFFTSTAPRWSACANRSYITTNDGQTFDMWDVGPVSNNGGTLSVMKTEEKSNGWACQRALTVANNVAFDVMGCSYNPADSAVKIAHQIEQGITTGGPGR